jgi:hypothetical protein
MSQKFKKGTVCLVLSIICCFQKDIGDSPEVLEAHWSLSANSANYQDFGESPRDSPSTSLSCETTISQLLEVSVTIIFEYCSMKKEQTQSPSFYRGPDGINLTVSPLRQAPFITPRGEGRNSLPASLSPASISSLHRKRTALVTSYSPLSSERPLSSPEKSSSRHSETTGLLPSEEPELPCKPRIRLSAGWAQSRAQRNRQQNRQRIGTLSAHSTSHREKNRPPP